MEIGMVTRAKNSWEALRIARERVKKETDKKVEAYEIKQYLKDGQPIEDYFVVNFREG